MKVVLYSYQDGEHVRSLYVDKDFESSKLPTAVKKIVSTKRSRICRSPIRLTPAEVAFFKKNGYLLALDVIITEFDLGCDALSSLQCKCRKRM